MATDGPSSPTGTARAHCNTCGWHWGVESPDADPGPCPSCGELKKVTVSVPKAQRSKKQQF
jgi:hypothetical protein